MKVTLEMDGDKLKFIRAVLVVRAKASTDGVIKDACIEAAAQLDEQLYPQVVEEKT